MSWETKDEYCGLEIEDKLLCKSANTNTTGQYLEKHSRLGDYAATKAFGVRSAPANSYTVADSFTLTGKKLGSVEEVDDKSYALEKINFSTGADQEPTFEATAQQVEDGAELGNYFEIPEFSLTPDHVAQIPSFKFPAPQGQEASSVAAFALPTGTTQAPKNTACELTKCDGEISCSVKTNDKTGQPKAHDVTNGHIVLQLTIGQYGEQKPEVTPAAGWDVSSPLTCDDPDSDTPTWTMTLTHPLKKTMAA